MVGGGSADAPDEKLLRVYTLGEAAEILRVRKSWLERQAAARKIPVTMLGGAYHFTAAHLAAIVQIHERIPAPSAGSLTGRSRPHRPAPSLPVDQQSTRPLRPRPRPAA